jgi:DNA repair protein RadD
MIGRGLRTAEGKADCLILDHSDNHTRLGFVTDIHHDKLDDGEPKRAAITNKTEALPKKCIKCTFLKPPKMLQCPCCGFIPVPQPGAVHRDGELIELASRRAAIATTQQERITFHAELRHIADQRSYKTGWAAQQYKTKFGSFPPWAWNERPTCTPSLSTLSWVRSRAIAFAKRRAS